MKDGFPKNDLVNCEYDWGSDCDDDEDDGDGGVYHDDDENAFKSISHKHPLFSKIHQFCWQNMTNDFKSTHVNVNYNDDDDYTDDDDWIKMMMLMMMMMITITLVMMMTMMMHKSAVHSGINPQLMCNENLQ